VSPLPFRPSIRPHTCLGLGAKRTIELTRSFTARSAAGARFVAFQILNLLKPRSFRIHPIATYLGIFRNQTMEPFTPQLHSLWLRSHDRQIANVTSDIYNVQRFPPKEL
jgi:hypothetical protein